MIKGPRPGRETFLPVSFSERNELHEDQRMPLQSLPHQPASGPGSACAGPAAWGLRLLWGHLGNKLGIAVSFMSSWKRGIAQGHTGCGGRIRTSREPAALLFRGCGRVSNPALMLDRDPCQGACSSVLETHPRAAMPRSSGCQAVSPGRLCMQGFALFCFNRAGVCAHACV